MELYRLIGFALASAVLSFTVRRFNEQAGLSLATAAAVFIMLSLLAAVTGFLNDVKAIVSLGGIRTDMLAAAIKAVGIAYTAQLASSICRDLGESSLAISSELVGRILLALLALPLIRSLAELLIKLIDQVL